MEPPPPKTYQNQTLEQILNTFSSQLEEHTLAYTQQATQIAHHDALLRDSQRNLSTLTRDVSKLLVQQEQLDQELSHIQTVQDTLGGDLLTGLEEQVQVLFQDVMGQGVDDADMEREKAYSLAMECERRLGGVEEGLKAFQGEMERLAERGGGSSEGGELDQIVKTMNEQHDLLSELEGACAVLEGDLNLVGQNMKALRM